VEQIPRYAAHPSEEMLEEYCFNRFPEESTPALEDHLFMCAPCQARVLEIDEHILLMKVATEQFAKNDELAQARPDYHDEWSEGSRRGLRIPDGPSRISQELASTQELPRTGNSFVPQWDPDRDPGREGAPGRNETQGNDPGWGSEESARAARASIAQCETSVAQSEASISQRDASIAPCALEESPEAQAGARQAFLWNSAEYPVILPLRPRVVGLHPGVPHEPKQQALIKQPGGSPEAVPQRIAVTKWQQLRLVATPRLIGKTILATCVGIAGAAGLLLLPPAPVKSATSVALSAYRGGYSLVARGPAAGPLDLQADVTDLPGADASHANALRLQVVDPAGRSVWDQNAPVVGGMLSAHVPKGLKAGVYWVRLYSASGELLREFGLRLD